MKIQSGLATLVIVGTLVLLTACTGAPIRVGAQDQQISRDDVDFSRGRHLTAKASGFQLLLVIPISINDRQSRAYQTLLSMAGNDYLSDVRIKESWTYALVGNVYTTTMEATAYPRRAAGK
jgi:hypothetical protein